MYTTRCVADVTLYFVHGVGGNKYNAILYGARTIALTVGERNIVYFIFFNIICFFFLSSCKNGKYKRNEARVLTANDQSWYNECVRFTKIIIYGTRTRIFGLRSEEVGDPPGGGREARTETRVLPPISSNRCIGRLWPKNITLSPVMFP